MLRLHAYLLLLAGINSFIPGTTLHKYHLHGRAQGTTWMVTYYATDSLVSRQQIDSILQVIESSMSLYNPYSKINTFNRSPRGIVVGHHFKKVVAKALHTWRETNGLFDITVLPLVNAWGFGSNPSGVVPDSAAITKLLRCTGSAGIQLKEDSLIKLSACLTIDLNGIAQGYSVDLLADFLEQHHIRHYLVELGGEIRVKGRRQPGNVKMKIGIESPDNDELKPVLLQKIVKLEKGAITTSGNYRRYYESEGRHITHLIDPRTGFPVRNELISVTVHAANAITADAFDNALMVMGLEKALTFTESRKDIAAYFIFRRKDGTVADTCSRNFRKLLK